LDDRRPPEVMIAPKRHATRAGRLNFELMSSTTPRRDRPDDLPVIDGVERVTCREARGVITWPRTLSSNLRKAPFTTTQN